MENLYVNTMGQETAVTGNNKNNKEGNNMNKTAEGITVFTVTGKQIHLNRTTALRVKTLASSGEITHEDVALYTGMYAACNSTIDEVVSMWGGKATPYKASTGKGIAKKKLDAINNAKMAQECNGMPQDAPEAPQAGESTEGNSNEGGSVKGQETAGNGFTGAYAQQAACGSTETDAMAMFESKFLKNEGLAGRITRSIINNLVNNAAKCTRRVSAVSIDYVNTYMAEDAICKATHGCWRNRLNETAVNKRFMELVLNKLCKDGITVPVYSPYGRLTGFRVRAEHLAARYGTDLCYKGTNGMSYEVHKDRTVCVNTGAVRTTTHALLHWLAKNATCTGTCAGIQEKAVTAGNGITHGNTAGTTGSSAMPEAPVAGKGTCIDREQLNSMPVKAMYDLFMANIADKKLAVTMVKYVSMFGMHGWCTNKNVNSIITCLLDIAQRYGAEATPASTCIQGRFTA